MESVWKDIELADKRAAIYHNMYRMLDAGLDILKTFKTLNQGLTGSYKRSWGQIELSVKAGASISDAMKEQGGAFDNFDILMINAAERSGNLAEACALIAKWYEFRHRIISKIKSGLIFPFFILNIAAFVIPVTYIVPGLVAGEAILGKYFGMVCGILLIFYIPAMFILAIMYLGKKFPVFRYVLDYAVLWIPAFGKGIFNLSLSRYSRSFYMLSSAGLGAIETAETACELTGNSFVKSLLQGGVKAVRAGNNASEGFIAEQLPTEFIDLWHVGEESGTIDKVASKLADIAADRAEFWFETFANWLPKVVYACVCVMMIIMVLKGYGKVYGGLGAGY